MKNLTLTLVALAAAVSFAGPTKTTKTKVMHCAVESKDVVNVAKATKSKLYADYKGRRYFFCCDSCPGAFKANPAKYAAKADSIPTPKSSKKKS